MVKLKKLLEQHGRWNNLTDLIERIDAHIDSDFSLSIENAKSLLETIGIEICNLQGCPLSKVSSISGILKNAFKALGYSNVDLVSQISSSLATIGQKLGELRNIIGLTSHGKTLEEIKNRNNLVDSLTRGFLIDSVDIVCCFLIRSYECGGKPKESKSLRNEIDYNDAVEFNSSWDEMYGDFQMGEYTYQASEILYYVDKQAYIAEHINFVETQGDE